MAGNYSWHALADMGIELDEKELWLSGQLALLWATFAVQSMVAHLVGWW